MSYWKLCLILCCLLQLEEHVLSKAIEDAELTFFDEEMTDFHEGRIVGGEPTTIEAFPYQVSLQFQTRHICGAAIVSDNIVITAAHCVVASNPRKFQVRVGSSQHARLGQLIQVNKIVRHEDYSPSTNENDIALLLLAQQLTFSSAIQAIRLPESTEQLEDGMELLVSGWGVQGAMQGVLPRVLRFVAVQLINQNVCRNNYRGVLPITSRMICAGHIAGGKDSCQGDSGGPLTGPNAIDGERTLYGIVSFGIGCAQKRFPGVYTNVIDLKPWIEQNMAILQNNQV